MRKCFFLFLWLACSFFGKAQSVLVRDNASRVPLEMVAIYSKSLNKGVFTDALGRADLSEFSGVDDIQFSLMGYRSVTYSYKALEAAGFRVFLNEANISLNTVVVSGSKWEQSSREVPNKITRISSADVQFQNPQTTADLLESSGLVFVQRSQLGGGSPMIRGFATNRVLITVDGVRMNTAIFRSGNVQNVISLDAFATENTEVVFGPGSSIYGSDAIGGVMNFYTLSPQLHAGERPKITGSSTLRYSTANNERTGHLDFNIGLKKWAFLSSITFSDFDDLRMGSRGPDEYLRTRYVVRLNGRDSILQNPDPRVQKPSGYQQFNAMQKVRFVPNSNWDIQYAFHYSGTSEYSRYDRLMRPGGAGLFSAEWMYGPQIWMMNQVSANLFASNAMFDQASFKIGQQFFEESRIDRNFGSVRRRTRLEQVDVFSANADFEKGINGKNRLFYGVEFVHNTVGSFGTDENIVSGMVEEASTRYPNGSKWNSFAAYSSFFHPISNKLNVQASGRWNAIHLDAVFDNRFYAFPFSKAEIRNNALTGSVGLVFNPSESMQMGTNLSTGFRAPNVDDIGKVFDSSPGFVIVPNSDLSPEYSRNLDFGIAKTFGSKLKLDATVFYNHLENALVRRNFSFNGQDSIMYDGEMSRVQAIQNVAYAKVWGMQLGFEMEFSKGFKLLSRYSWQKGNEELDDESLAPLRHAPPAFGLTRLSYQNKGFRAEFAAQYNAEVPFDRLAPEEVGKEYIYAIDPNGNPFSPRWFTLDIKVQYQFNSNYSLNVGLENLLDERYRPYSSGIVAPGRNLIISFRGNLK